MLRRVPGAQVTDLEREEWFPLDVQGDAGFGILPDAEPLNPIALQCPRLERVTVSDLRDCRCQPLGKRLRLHKQRRAVVTRGRHCPSR